MAFDWTMIRNRIGKEGFFTSNREIIEFMIEQNLDSLEEYALVITGEDAVIITPHPIRLKDVRLVEYCGYSAVTFQHKILNIIAELSALKLPQMLHLCYETERFVYVDEFMKQNRRLKNCNPWMKELLKTKSQKQIERIKQCVQLNEKAYKLIQQRFQRGMSELDLYKTVKESYHQNTNENIPFICDIAAGRRSCGVSGPPTNYQPRPGDTIIMDLLPRYRGLYCDHTRTFFVGEPSTNQRRIYELLQKALHHAETYLKPGVKGSEIYKAIYSTFKEEDLQECFPHHGGHGFGLGIYEPPYFIKKEEEVLQTGMTVAIEPGIYLPGNFGIRIENNYLITEQGYQCIGNIPLKMEDYII